MPVPSIPSFFKRPVLVAPVVVLGLSLGVAACGGSDSSSSAANASATTQQGPGGGRPGFNLTAAQQACLKKEGVTVPGRGAGGQRPNGAPGNGTRTTPNGTPPSGGPPSGGPPTGGATGANAQRFEKQRAAMEKCGIQLPTRPQGGQGYRQGQPPAQSDSSGASSAS